MVKQQSNKIYAVRRNYNEEFLVALTNIKKDTEQIFNRLDKINGTIGDYPITKERLNNACIKIEELDTTITDKLVPVITSIKIKIWSVAAVVGVICGSLGSGVSFLVQKLGGA